MSHVPLPAAGSFISLVAGLVFGIAAFVGAYQMSKNDKNIWVSLGKSVSVSKRYIYIYIYIHTRTQLIQMEKLIYDINGICCYVCRHLGITDHSNGSEIFEFLEDHASWTHGRSKAGIFYFSYWLFIYIIYLFQFFFVPKDFPDVHNVHIQQKKKKNLGIIDINMDRCIIFVVDLCFMNYELYVLFYSLPLLQFVDVPEDWCESSTEFTKEEKITAFRNYLQILRRY